MKSHPKKVKITLHFLKKSDNFHFLRIFTSKEWNLTFLEWKLVLFFKGNCIFTFWEWNFSARNLEEIYDLKRPLSSLFLWITFSLEQWTLPQLSISTTGTLTSSVYKRVFYETNEVTTSVSPAERAALAKIEQFEVAIVRKV